MKVSIITSTFNSASTLKTALDSVRNQDYSDIEYIVVDGGSTDATVDIIQASQDIISKWVSEPDEGIYDALNKGISMATGDVIGFVHSDDYLASPSTITQLVSAFEKEECDAVYGDLDYVDKSDVSKVIRKWRSKPFSPKLFHYGWMPAHPTFYLKRSAYEEYGMYRTDFRISADYELMLRMMVRHEIKSAYLPQVMVKMRVGGESNASFKNRVQANKEDAAAWKLNGLKPYPFTRFLKPLSKLIQFF